MADAAEATTPQSGAKRARDGRRNRIEEYDLQIYLPVSFAGLLFKFASEFKVDAVSLFMRRKSLEVALNTEGPNVVVNILVNLSSARYSLTELTPNGILSSGSYTTHVNPNNMIKALELVKTGCESVRIKTGQRAQKILVEGGTMRRPSELGRQVAKKPKKTAAADQDAEPEDSELVWDSPHDARLPKIESVGKQYLLRGETPPDAIILRFSALYLHQRLKKAIGLHKDTVVVTLTIVGRDGHRHPRTNKALAPGVTMVDIEETVEEKQKRLECIRKKQPLPPPPKPYESWIPTGLHWEFTAAGSAIDSSTKFSFIDRTEEYEARADDPHPTTRDAAAYTPVVDWDNEDVDVENPLQGRTDRSLGLYEASNTVAELLTFPTNLKEGPQSWSYSANQLLLVLGGSSFNRNTTVHINDDSKINGALWFCYPLGNNGEAGIMHALIAPLTVIDDG